MTDGEYLKLAWEAIMNKKGKEPLLLQLGEVSRVTDYFLIVSADNVIQAKAIADQIEEVLLEAGLALLRKEGYQHGNWILLDYGFLVIHILLKAEREFYRLEHLWHDAKPLDMPVS
jgi:ribosome-associated protein